MKVAVAIKKMRDVSARSIAGSDDNLSSDEIARGDPKKAGFASQGMAGLNGFPFVRPPCWRGSNSFKPSVFFTTDDKRQHPKGALTILRQFSLMPRQVNLMKFDPFTLDQASSLNGESDLWRAFGDVLRSRIRPYYKDLGGEEVAGFVGLGENWIQAPGELALMLYAEGSGYEFRAEDFGMDFDEICIKLESIGTQEAFLSRGALGQALIASVASDMTSRFDSEYRVFETENLGVPYFAQQPRFMEATSSLVGVVKVHRALDDETHRAELLKLSSGRNSQHDSQASC